MAALEAVPGPASFWTVKPAQLYRARAKARARLSRCFLVVGSFCLGGCLKVDIKI